MTPATIRLKCRAIPLVAKILETLKVFGGGRGDLSLFTVGVKNHGVES
ncbi:uncharacterized protein METZ01_LOCUS383708 [marine metagenome]|uniref:Uncharacterized protein n=1 Tax=marine metagenome TaxID=408172 RepID=A0A382U980_9ZZZZ